MSHWARSASGGSAAGWMAESNRRLRCKLTDCDPWAFYRSPGLRPSWNRLRSVIRLAVRGQCVRRTVTRAAVSAAVPRPLPLRPPVGQPAQQANIHVFHASAEPAQARSVRALASALGVAQELTITIDPPASRCRITIIMILAGRAEIGPETTLRHKNPSQRIGQPSRPARIARLGRAGAGGNGHEDRGKKRRTCEAVPKLHNLSLV
jgi:hypothetical protein